MCISALRNALIFQNAEVEEEQLVDERSVDDLLSFINGGDAGVLEKFSCFILYMLISVFKLFIACLILSPPLDAQAYILA